MPVDSRRAGVAWARAALAALCALLLLMTGMGSVAAKAAGAAGADAVVLPPGPPLGTLENAAPSDGGAVVSGWVVDPDTRDPVNIVLQIDAACGGVPFSANGYRPDIGNLHKDYGDNHGFSVSVPLAPGPHSICVHAENLGGGPPRVLGCRDFAVDTPFGVTGRISRVPEGVAAWGWIIDDDVDGGRGPAPFLVNVGGTWHGPYVADAPRPDLDAVHGWAGNRHGFGVVLPLPPTGPVWVCIHPIDAGSSPPVTTVQGCALDPRQPHGRRDA